MNKVILRHRHFRNEDKDYDIYTMSNEDIGYHVMLKRYGKVSTHGRVILDCFDPFIKGKHTSKLAASRRFNIALNKCIVSRDKNGYSLDPHSEIEAMNKDEVRDFLGVYSIDVEETILTKLFSHAGKDEKGGSLSGLAGLARPVTDEPVTVDSGEKYKDTQWGTW